jgi:hypothetical protein
VVERLSELEKWRIAEFAAQGLPSRVIGKEIGRSHRAVWGEIARSRRAVVPEPVRSRLRLSLSEREEISRGLAGGEALRAIARRLGRSSSTISREVTANGGRPRSGQRAPGMRGVRRDRPRHARDASQRESRRRARLRGYGRGAGGRDTRRNVVVMDFLRGLLSRDPSPKRTWTLYHWRCPCGSHSRGGDPFERDAEQLAREHQLRKGAGHPMPEIYSTEEERDWL